MKKIVNKNYTFKKREREREKKEERKKGRRKEGREGRNERKERKKGGKRKEKFVLLELVSQELLCILDHQDKNVPSSFKEIDGHQIQFKIYNKDQWTNFIKHILCTRQLFMCL